MKLNDNQVLKLENLVLKRDSFSKDLAMLENQFSIISQKRSEIVNELDKYIKIIGGKEYKKDSEPHLDLEKQELTFEVKNA